MPSISGSRRRTRDELEEDESDSSTTSRDLEPPKRARMLGSTSQNGLSNGSSSRRRNGNASSDSSEPSEPIPPGEYHPGSIVRVSVKNFVTYDEAEFLPGPNLNMVIGPNGTGKSSLVCAICLGLGYSPRYLGRAASVKEFVKIGTDVATIEIELKKRATDRQNHVIRVQIKREQNSQKWWLNGKETSQKVIQKLMREFKVQVDNLCQFLPQDRVVEFAACTPVELFHETLRAVAPDEMLEWHQELLKLHREKKDLGETAEMDAETLRGLESRQQGLQADVDRIREREEIMQHVKNLKTARSIAEYNEVREKLTNARLQKKAAEKALGRLRKETGPVTEAIKRKQTYAQKTKALVPMKERLQRNSEVESARLLEEVSNATERVSEWRNKIDAERTGFEEKKKELALSRQKITALQADQRSRPPDFNGPEWNQKVRAEEHNLRELEREGRDIDGQLAEVKAQGAPKRQEMKNLQDHIKMLSTQEGQQMALLKKVLPDAAVAWEWVQNNMDKFEKEVFGPAMISCSIKDERYSDHVQSLLSNDDFTCIIAQTRNDSMKLSNRFYKEMSLTTVIRTCTNSLDSFKPPMGGEEARKLGLDGFAIDFVEGPAPVLAMLCAEKKIHLAGVSLNEHTSEQYDRLVQSRSVSQWAAGTQTNLVRRRAEYGPQAMTAITKPIPPGRFWAPQTFDSQEKLDTTRRLSRVQEEFDALKSRNQELNQQRKDIESRINDLTKTIDKIKEEKSVLQQEFQKWQSLPDKITHEETKRGAIEQAMRDIRKNLTDLQYEWDDAVISRAEVVLRHARSLETIGEAHREVVEAKIQVIEAESDVEGLKLQNSRITEKLADAQRQITETSEECNRLRRMGAELQEELNFLHELSKEERALLSQLQEEKTSDDLRLDIAAEEAKLELIHAANPNVVREFEKRAAEISRVQRRMETSTGSLQKLTQEIEVIMGKWEPKLEELVNNINTAFAFNFEQISCAGEVRVHRDPDFNLWSLEVMVKFREGEELQQLNAHRQSGGERAVSTIFYLMALQSLAKAPFRVVDEINQGMDPRNERMVHERMVEIACNEYSSQYFLITPKLLSNLQYDPRMRVLCIASGEHMPPPSESTKLDFKQALKIQKSLMAVT